MKLQWNLRKPGFAITTGTATITMTSGTNDCVVHYNQAGNSNYNDALEKTETVTAQKKALTVTAKIDSIPWAEVDAVFLNAASNAFSIGEVALCHSSNRDRHFRGGRGVQSVEPLRVWRTPICSEEFTYVNHNLW